MLNFEFLLNLPFVDDSIVQKSDDNIKLNTNMTVQEVCIYSTTYMQLHVEINEMLHAL